MVTAHEKTTEYHTRRQTIVVRGAASVATSPLLSVFRGTGWFKGNQRCLCHGDNGVVRSAVSKHEPLRDYFATSSASCHFGGFVTPTALQATCVTFIGVGLLGRLRRTFVRDLLMLLYKQRQQQQ